MGGSGGVLGWCAGVAGLPNWPLLSTPPQLAFGGFWPQEEGTEEELVSIGHRGLSSPLGGGCPWLLGDGCQASMGSLLEHRAPEAADFVTNEV